MVNDILFFAHKSQLSQQQAFHVELELSMIHIKNRNVYNDLKGSFILGVVKGKQKQV